MGELEDPQRRADVLGVDVARRGQRGGDLGRLVAELGLFGGQRRFVDRPREVRVQETFLHRLDLGHPLLVAESLMSLDFARVSERGLQRLMKPVGEVVFRDADRFEVGDDGVLEIIRSPTNGGMVVTRVVVGATVVIVDANTATLQLSFDSFAGDERAAVLAGK